MWVVLLSLLTASPSREGETAPGIECPTVCSEFKMADSVAARKWSERRAGGSAGCSAQLTVNRVGYGIGFVSFNDSFSDSTSGWLISKQILVYLRKSTRKKLSTTSTRCRGNRGSSSGPRPALSRGLSPKFLSIGWNCCESGTNWRPTRSDGKKKREREKEKDCTEEDLKSSHPKPAKKPWTPSLPPPEAATPLAAEEWLQKSMLQMLAIPASRLTPTCMLAIPAMITATTNQSQPIMVVKLQGRTKIIRSGERKGRGERGTAFTTGRRDPSRSQGPAPQASRRQGWADGVIPLQKSYLDLEASTSTRRRVGEPRPCATEARRWKVTEDRDSSEKSPSMIMTKTVTKLTRKTEEEWSESGTQPILSQKRRLRENSKLSGRPTITVRTTKNEREKSKGLREV